MPIYKRCSRCGKRILSGTNCECRKQRYKEYDHVSRDKRSTEFYHSGQWESIREAALNADGSIDVYLYMTEGKIVIADTVHHIEPLKDAWEKRCDINNLMSLHHDTHSMIEQLYKKDKKRMEKALKEMLCAYREQAKGEAEKFWRTQPDLAAPFPYAKF